MKIWTKRNYGKGVKSMNEFDFDDENRKGECSYCKRCEEHEFLLDGRNCCIIHQRFERGVL